MSILIAILLQLVAFGVGVAEILIPSMGILSVIALGILGYSWFYILQELPQGAAVIFGIADIILIPILIYSGFKVLGKSGISHDKGLDRGSGMEAEESKWLALVGQRAKVVATLRPGGQIQVGERVYEATTLGDYVDRGKEVTVVSIEGHRIIVEPDEPVEEKQSQGETES